MSEECTCFYFFLTIPPKTKFFTTKLGYKKTIRLRLWFGGRLCVCVCLTHARLWVQLQTLEVGDSLMSGSAGNQNTACCSTLPPCPE